MNAAVTSSRTVGLLLATGIAAIVAAIAIPNLKLGRITANEASAKRMLHAINTAQQKFSASNPAKGYACSFGELAEARLIPNSLESGKTRDTCSKSLIAGREHLTLPIECLRIP